jgi:hypothetical protein
LPLNCGNWPINGIKLDLRYNLYRTGKAALTNRGWLR